MSEEKHTPDLPWSYQRREGEGALGSRDWIEDARGNIVVEHVGYLDGPLIVRAVNSHHTMLDALREIASLKSEPIGDTGFSVGPLALLNRAQEVARAAIAASGEKG